MLEENLTVVVGRHTMTPPQPPVLEFPAMLYGSMGEIRRKVRTAGQQWGREYLKTGVFSPPNPMLPLVPGEVLVMHSGAELGSAPQSWRIHMFLSVFLAMRAGVQEQEQKQELQRMEDVFADFCLSTPWGALYLIVSPSARCGVNVLANRFAAALHFWRVLQTLRYAFWAFNKPCTLEDLLEFLYRKTLEAWYPGGPASLREHMALAAERMSRATRAECEQVLLRLIPVLVEGDREFKHPEVLRDRDFLRERFSVLPSEKFEHFSGGELYSVTIQLASWDRELGGHQPTG